MTYVPQLAVLFLLLVAVPASAEIPDWYKRDIVAHIASADSIVVYRTERVSVDSTVEMYTMYRIDTTTLRVLKGEAPPERCYLFQVEGEWEDPDPSGVERILILPRRFESECGLIEPGRSAPATAEYLELFETIIRERRKWGQ